MVRAIDLQHVILQLPATEKVQQTQRQHPDLQQRYFELQLSEEQKLMKEKISDTGETEHMLLRDRDNRDQKEKQEGGQEEEGGKKMPGDEQRTSEQGGLININI